MTENLRLTCIFAHPDDESMGTGGILARYAAEGVAISLVCATRGERGWMGPEADYPGPAALGRLREAELRQAAALLGIGDLAFLDYVDGDLDAADPAEATRRIVAELRRLRPHVVVTFGPDGAYGHPDHIAICQLVTAAVALAGEAGYGPPEPLPHRVSKLYYFVVSEEEIDLMQRVYGDVRMDVDGVVRRLHLWPAWAVTARVECGAYWPTVLAAVRCHASQLSDMEPILATLTDAEQARLWGELAFYRVLSQVNGGRRRETDLFEGLR
jgi:LmbE family N-acetylglucosaminyl deacetylase